MLEDNDSRCRRVHPAKSCPVFVDTATRPPSAVSLVGTSARPVFLFALCAAPIWTVTMPSPEAVGAMTRVKIAPAPAPLSSVANRATARRDVPGGRSQEKLPSRASPTEAMYPAAGTPPAPTPAPAVAPAALARHRGTCKGDTYPSGPDPDRRSWIASSRATPLPLCHDGRGPPPAATCAPLALGGSRACGHAWPCQARLQLPRPPLPPAPPSRLPPAHRAAHEDAPASRRRCPPAPGGPSCCVSLTRAPPPPTPAIVSPLPGSRLPCPPGVAAA